MAKNSVAKTNAARLLDKAGIAYSLIPYDVDPEHLDALHVAECLNENVDQVFKTLILHGDKGYFVCVIPGNKEVDLKKAAKAIGAKKVDLIPMKELLPITGYIRGGCSPLGLKKPFPIFFHSSAMNYVNIFISAGVRGLQISVNPQLLIKYLSAELTDLIKEGVEL